MGTTVRWQENLNDISIKDFSRSFIKKNKIPKHFQVFQEDTGLYWPN
jgi:hypothetical protein